MKMVSKSAYQRARQCVKSAWMAEHMPEQADESLSNKSLQDSGNEVGDLAMGVFGDFVEIGQTFDFEGMADRTRRCLEASRLAASRKKRSKSVCEATFADADGNLCMADIVRVKRDGSLVVTEVKSSTKVKPQHVSDAAFQTWVIERCGWKVGAVRIMHLDGNYQRRGDLDVKGLFKVEDVTKAVREEMRAVPGALEEMRETSSAGAEPDVPIGKHCNSPYPCPYQKWCWRDVPAEGSVFDLAGVGRVRGIAWWGKGVRTFADAKGRMKPNGLRDAQIKCAVEGAAEAKDAEKLRGFLAKLSWPIAHLDFETVQMAVPLWDGTKPYQQVATQYSLHIQREPGGELEHLEFLAPEQGDPRRALAERLVADIPQGACVTAYNMSFERGRITEMADAFPDLAPRLTEIRDSIVDLMEPFQKGWLYRTSMGASYSIKSVLPAFHPGDPDLDYHALDGVRNGTEAAAAFANLALMGPEERARTRESLLRYCELDTLAMVKVLESVIEAAAE